jgi:serine/threonine protein kinase
VRPQGSTQYTPAVTSVSALIAPGTSVGPYVVERRLAQGGMSVLFLARDVDGSRIVLKMVPPGIATNAARVRLMREARALAVVDHPGVVRVRSTGEHADMPWIAMDYVNGLDLKRIIAERGPMRPEAAIGYAIQAAEALVAAHRAGVVHRDLKPSNLLLTGDGRIVLVDFGIAKRRADVRDGDVLTSAREVIGTPAYLSPEQIEHGLADERSDVWALGCVLYEMVVGTPPFGRGGSATTAAILRDEPTFPPFVPNVVGDIVSACLRKSSFARIGSARDLLPLLRSALEHSSGAIAEDSDRTSSSSMRVSTRPSARVSLTSGAVQAPSRHPSIPPPRPQSGAPVRPLSVPPARLPSIPPPRPPSIAPPRPPSIPPSRPSTLPPPSEASSRPPAPYTARAGPAAPPRSSGSIRVAAARGRIKGTSVRAGLLWYAEAYGEILLGRVYNLASPELRGLLRAGDPAFGIMASAWYETPQMGELLDLLERVAAPDDSREFASRLAAAVARDNVNGVYRALFRLIASPPLLEANAQRVWGTYVDEGTLTVRVLAPGSFEGRVRGWSHHHPTVCLLLRPFVEHLLRSIGYSACVVERTQCVDNGDGQCLFTGNWLP